MVQQLAKLFADTLNLVDITPMAPDAYLQEKLLITSSDEILKIYVDAAPLVMGSVLSRRILKDVCATCPISAAVENVTKGLRTCPLKKTLQSENDYLFSESSKQSFLKTAETVLKKPDKTRPKGHELKVE